jgi:predicted  nucleic acid-binding Zn-ribbon protein
MHPAVFLVALLSTVGIAAFTVVKVARLFTTRRELPPDVTGRLAELEGDVQRLQQELGETQERLDFAERLLSTVRDERRIGS